MSFSVSSLGLQLFSTANLQAEQLTLSQLTEQLASNKQHTNLTDYAPIDAQQLINFQNAITQRQAYVSAMKNVSPRLKIYDTTMTDMESIASQAAQLANQNPFQDTQKVGVIQQQVVAFINQAVADLNQKVGTRFIYAGTRYSTQPVDLDAVLANFAPSATPVTANTLPDYDTDQPGSSASAWTNDSVTIDVGNTLTYGVTSVQTGFQQLIAGLEFINAATQTGTSAATYSSNMSQAATLLQSALTNIQTYHAGTAAAINTVNQQTDIHNQDISSLQQQIGDIQRVDLTKVGTEINLMQTQLQASYSATASLIQQSILKYL